MFDTAQRSLGDYSPSLGKFISADREARLWRRSSPTQGTSLPGIGMGMPITMRSGIMILQDAVLEIRMIQIILIEVVIEPFCTLFI